MKKIYEEPSLLLMILGARDVISSSGEFGDDSEDFPGLDNKGDLSSDGWGPIIRV